MRKTIERYCDTPNCLNLALPDRKHCSKCKSRRQRENNAETVAFHKMKSKAKKRGIDFNLTLEEFTEFCDIHNYIELKGMGAEDYTIDRPNENEGYHKNNIQLMKRGDNTRKYYTYLKNGGGWVGKCPKADGDPF